MKSALPWVLVVALLAGVIFLFTANQKQEKELAQLRQQTTELDRLRTENAELSKIPALTAELDRLKKENEDLLRLRNEIHRLRDQASQLTNQLVVVQRTQAQQEQKLQQQQSQQERVAQLAAENQAMRDRQAQQAAAVAHDACIVTLRMLDGAKQQWALENKKTATAIPTFNDIAPYLPRGLTNCPSGGSYSLNRVDQPPTCTTPGHQLQ